MYHYIYKTTCIVTNKFYYGMHSTTNLNDGYKGSGKILMRSIKKYGMDAHITEIISYYTDRELLKHAEKIIINESLLENPLCMNLKIGGEGGGQRGIKRSSDTIYRMRQGRLKLLSEGWKPSELSIEEMKNKLRGRKHTDETKRKMADAHNGKAMPPFSDEHKAKLSAARRIRVTSDITRERIAESMRNNPKNVGWQLSDESKEKQKQSVRTALTNIPKEKVICPWCGKIGGKPAMSRFHLDKCKHKKESI